MVMTLGYRDIRRYNINSFFNRRCPRRRRCGFLNSLIKDSIRETHSKEYKLPLNSEKHLYMKHVYAMFVAHSKFHS